MKPLIQSAFVIWGSWFATVLVLWVTLLSSPASAVPLLWTLDDVSFAGGGTAAGSFIFDAQTSSYNNVLITTTGGGSGDLTFDFVLGGTADGVSLLRNGDAPDFNGAPSLRLRFIASLTDVGGTIGLELNSFQAGLAGCLNADCTLIASGGDGEFVSGSVIAEATAQVPEPGTLALFGAPLVAVFWLRRQRPARGGVKGA